MLEFGHRDPDRTYLDRPGAYVLIFRSGGEMVAEKGRKGLLYLPGGGTEGDETPKETAVREAREELGVEIRVGRRVGEAAEYVAASDGDYRKLGVFFEAEVPGEHDLLWVPVEEFLKKTGHDSHAWAVQEAMKA